MRIPLDNWLILIPELLLLIAAMKVLLIGAFTRGWMRRAIPWGSFAAVALVIVVEVLLWNRPTVAFNGMLVSDNFTILVNIAILIGTALAILLSVDYSRREELPQGEYYGLIMLSTLGMLLMAASSNLIMIFLSLEVLSIALYVLTCIARHRATSQEAGMKYFLLGSFASAFLVYGSALVYGATGSLSLPEIAQAPANTLLYAGAALIIVGLGFKVAVVPFQMWTPDVYEGAPTSVTAFMSVGTKAAAFAALLRVLLIAFPTIQPVWVDAIWLIAVLTMIVGNVLAITQSSIKRLLAYSSIAHAGYILVAVTAANTLAGKTGANELAIQSIPFYLITYAFMNIGAWAVVTAVTKKGDEATALDDYAGLFWNHPALATAMGLFMFALAGLPPTAGFTAKVFVFVGAYRAGMIGLVIAAVVTSIISAYYYLRVTVMMFMQRPKQSPVVSLTWPTATAIAISAAATIWLLIFPASTRSFDPSVANIAPSAIGYRITEGTPNMITEGQKAPEFSLPTIGGKTISLRDFEDKQNVILYFYPKDDTPGCTKEACFFRDLEAEFKAANTAILGVSTDSVASHEKFAEKFHLPFPLLADEEKTVVESYGVWKEKINYGKNYMGVERTTFIIDKHGTVRKIYPKVKVEGHVDEVLEFVKSL